MTSSTGRAQPLLSGIALLLAWQTGTTGAEPLFDAIPNSPASVDGGLSRGVAFGDADGDGSADLLVANTINYPEFLYRNDDGQFRQVMETPISLAGGYTESVSWIDFDNDGDLDVFAVRTIGTNSLYRNDGDWQFVEIDAGELTGDQGASSMACWADVDNDGWLDVFVVNRNGEDDALYRGVHGERFHRLADVAPSSNGGDGRTCAFGDLNDDGFVDLFVGNFLDARAEPVSKATNFLYANRGNLEFIPITTGDATAHRSLTYGSSWVDIDNDGDLDLFVTNIGIEDRNRLFLNDGKGHLRLADAGIDGGLDRPSKGHAWGDYNLDGFVDLAVANGTEDVDAIENILYLSDRKGGFSEVKDEAFVLDRGISAGLAWADLDIDGDLDLYVANWGGGDEDNVLYENNANGSWLEIELEGTKSNRMAIGAKVVVVHSHQDTTRRQIRWLYPQTGYGSQNEPILHFGLNGADCVETLEVFWPSGMRSYLASLGANQRLVVREGDAEKAARADGTVPDSQGSTECR